MADTKISALANAAALGGTEQIPAVQSGGNVKVTPAQMATYVQQASGSVRVLASSAVQVSSTAANANNTALVTVTIPAGAMGTNGRLRVTALWSYTNNANVKRPRIFFNGLAGTQYCSFDATTTTLLRAQVEIQNRNSASSQVGQAIDTTWGARSGSFITSTVDTSAAVDLVIGYQTSTVGEVIALESYLVELITP